MSYSIRPEAELGDAAVYYATHASEIMRWRFLKRTNAYVNGPQILANAHQSRYPDTGMTESELLIAQLEQRKLLAFIGKLE